MEITSNPTIIARPFSQFGSCIGNLRLLRYQVSGKVNRGHKAKGEQYKCHPNRLVKRVCRWHREFVDAISQGKQCEKDAKYHHSCKLAIHAKGAKAFLIKVFPLF